jgi:sugar-specific transcriptional regulator TrmB
MWHFNGREQTNNKIKNMIQNAERSIYLDIWAENYDFIYEDLLAAYNRGVEIVSVIYGKISNEIGKVYYHEMYGLDKDVEKNGRWLSLVVDYSECFFGILKGDESKSIWTQNKAFMLVTECFITHDIYISEIYLKYKDLLDREFGYNLENIRKNLHIG